MKSHQISLNPWIYQRHGNSFLMQPASRPGISSPPQSLALYCPEEPWSHQGGAWGMGHGAAWGPGHEVSQLVPHNSSFTLVHRSYNRVHLVYAWGLRSNNNSQASLVVWMVVIAGKTIAMVDSPASHVQFGWLVKISKRNILGKVREIQRGEQQMCKYI